MTEQEVKLQLAEIAGTWVAALAVVIGGLFGIFQYLEHKAAVRVDRSMAFVERYHGDGMLVAARLKIIDSMALRAPQLKLILQDSSLKSEDLQVKYDAEILKQITEDQLNGALEQLFTFYEQIILCRQMDLCDEQVASQFFDTDAEGFVLTFYPYICDVRQTWNNPMQYQKVTEFYRPKLAC